MCGKTPSSMPVRKTVGNSRPLAVCSVMSVMTPVPSPPSSLSGIWSESATRATCSRNSASVPGLVLAALLLELERDGGEFLQVLDAGLVLRVGGRLQFGEIARLLQHRLQHGRRPGAGLGDRAQLLHQRVEALHGVRGPGGHAVRLVDAGQRLREGDLLARRERLEHGLGPVPDAALGHVEDAAQRHRVLRVGQHPQVRQHVADLTALVEAHAADDLVGQPDPDEDLFEDTGLGVGAVEDGDVAGLSVARVGEPVDLVGDELRLVVLGVGDIAGDPGTGAGLRPQVLRAAVLVPLDDGVRGAEDGLRGAVVLLEQDGGGVRIVLLELEDVADRGAAEGVDRLVGVTDDAQFGPLARPPRPRRCRPARGPGCTGRGWCPGTRRPARAGSGAGSARPRRGRPAAGARWS